jgi:hypothetical protein
MSTGPRQIGDMTQIVEVSDARELTLATCADARSANIIMRWVLGAHGQGLVIEKFARQNRERIPSALSTPARSDVRHES